MGWPFVWLATSLPLQLHMSILSGRTTSRASVALEDAMPRGIRMPTGIARLLASDPSERLLYDLEEARTAASTADLLRTLQGLVWRQRKQPRVGNGWIHATDSLLPCDRLLAGALLGVPPPRSPISPQTRRIFDNGTFMHLRYYTYFRLLPKPYKVEAAKMLYRWPLIGEADVRVQHPDLGKLVIELKSINGSQFKQLSQPNPDHAAQDGVYIGMSGEGWTGQVWYESKNTQELKMFPVEANYHGWEATWRRASIIAYGLLAQELPRFCDACPDHEFCEDRIVLTAARLEELDAQRQRAEANRSQDGAR